MASPREVTNETNTRFWIMTSYKPGIPLDPADPADKRMARVWLDVYRDLLRQNARGTISLTHKHPELADRMNRAIRAYQIESTTRQSDPRYAEARAEKAQAINEAGYWQALLSGRRIAGDPAVAAWPWYSLYAIGMEGYGLPRRGRSGGDTTSEPIKTGYRENALQRARAVHTATNNPNIGYRDTPWGGELVVFDQRSAMDRWQREQAADQDVWYAVTFRLDTYGGTPTSEVIR